jgi:hypothetical protein
VPVSVERKVPVQQHGVVRQIVVPRRRRLRRLVL